MHANTIDFSHTEDRKVMASYADPTAAHEMLFTVRDYKHSDYDTVRRWWERHNEGRTLSQEILPPLGIMVEDHLGPVCALWVHLSVGLGYAILECPVSRPGIDAKKAKHSFGIALGGAIAACRKHDYGLLVCNTPIAIARVLERDFGFEHDHSPLKKTMYRLI